MRSASFENGDVLLHRSEAHRVTPGQVGYGVLALQHQPNDVTPCRIGQRMEQKIRSLRFDCSCTTYNHMVVR